MHRLVDHLKHHSLDPRDAREPRKSARLEARNKGPANVHDSGTESDDEEMANYARRSLERENYEALMSGANPPALSASPPLASEIDTESWDSFGKESGILTGDADSDWDDHTQTRRMRSAFRDSRPSRPITKEECEFPMMNATGPSGASSTSGGEKRKYSENSGIPDEPISSRLRSNIEPREMIVAARRTPVRLLINTPYMHDHAAIQRAAAERAPPSTKRHRRDSWRPSLDLEKMNKNRILSMKPICCPDVSSTTEEHDDDELSAKEDDFEP